MYKSTVKHTFYSNSRIDGAIYQKKSYGSFAITSLVREKIDLLITLDRTEELEILIKAYLHEPEIREVAVERKIAAGRLDEARKLCLDAIKTEGGTLFAGDMITQLKSKYSNRRALKEELNKVL